jgi:predicted dehydrogenase
MIKIGLMGCGMVADYGHIPALLDTPELSLCSLYDPNEKNLLSLKTKYGIPQAFTDPESFFRSGIDAVTITSPAPFHKVNVLDAARFKKPVLCEKPLSMDKTESEEMILAMEKAGLSFHAGFCYRFSPSALKIRQLIREKAVGEVRSMRLIYLWDCHGKYDIDASGNRIIRKRREEKMAEGGPLVDCGTHQIDLAGFWLDSGVVSFSGQGAWVDDYPSPDHVWLHMVHANGAHTAVEVSYSYYHTSKEKHREFVYEIIGTKGVIRYDREAKSFTLSDQNGTSALDFQEEKSFSGMYREWAKALLTGRSDLLPGAAQGMRVTEIAREATDEAIRRRKAG